MNVNEDCGVSILRAQDFRKEGSIMTDEDFFGYLEQGWIAVPHTAIRNVRDSTDSKENKRAELARIFSTYGLDLNKPMRMSGYMDRRMYLFYPDEDGKLITVDDLQYF